MAHWCPLIVDLHPKVVICMFTRGYTAYHGPTLRHCPCPGPRANTQPAGHPRSTTWPRDHSTPPGSGAWCLVILAKEANKKPWETLVIAILASWNSSWWNIYPRYPWLRMHWSGPSCGQPIYQQIMSPKKNRFHPPLRSLIFPTKPPWLTMIPMISP